jgi:eukaryotic-like serine/threonine-protein kinase
MGQGWMRAAVVPVLAGLVVAGVGTWAHRNVEATVRGRLTEDLQTLLKADVAALELWLDSQRATAAGAAADQAVRRPIQRIAARARDGATADALRGLPELADLREALARVIEVHGYRGFVVFDRTGRIVAGRQDATIGLPVPLGEQDLGRRLAAGETVVGRPTLFKTQVGSGTEVLAEEPMMFVAAPVLGETGEPIAGLGFGIHPSQDFTRILNVARFGESGETYAFDAQGTMLSESRFLEELQRLGLLDDPRASRSTLNLGLRDPGGNLLEGFAPRDPRPALPLTSAVRHAAAGGFGVDVEGRRDYRGVPTVSAWTWLPEHGFGVATQVDFDEAYRTIHILRVAFRTLLTLLALGTIGAFAYAHLVYGLQRRVQRAERLGQYTLEEKIGEGGMGTVYRARHAMMRRPTAVKLLRSADASPTRRARFEREVQLTSGLTHPNTIAVYDYGRTPDGAFYYAMELLPGLSLDALIEHDGPQPESRIVHILRQAAGALDEAHGIGLIHRDIKPANLILCERGGIPDVVKVLDFGLVKELDQAGELALTAADVMTGTPLYMAPEMIRSGEVVDARSDIYALGAVAYNLVTGQLVFEARSAMEAVGRHLRDAPVPPSRRLGRPVDERLEKLILRCLAKEKADRPADGAALLEALDEVAAGLPPWTKAEAREWWERRGRDIVQEVARERRGALGSQEPELQVAVDDRTVTRGGGQV